MQKAEMIGICRVMAGIKYSDEANDVKTNEEAAAWIICEVCIFRNGIASFIDDNRRSTLNEAGIVCDDSQAASSRIFAYHVFRGPRELLEAWNISDD